MMEALVEVKDDDLILYVKNILRSRIMPINYAGLCDLVKLAPPSLKTFADSKYKDDKFLNFLLSHPGIFNVSSDGTVTLIDGVEFTLPQSVDTVDSIAAISDDSYFGDREEYISDSDDDSHTSISSSDILMFQKDDVGVVDNVRKPVKEAFLPKLKDVANSQNCVRECECDTTSSSESSHDFLSSASQSGGTTSGGSNGSFESCNERDNCHTSHMPSSSRSTSGSSSYSSCSES